MDLVDLINDIFSKIGWILTVFFFIGIALGVGKFLTETFGYSVNLIFWGFFGYICILRDFLK